MNLNQRFVIHRLQRKGLQRNRLGPKVALCIMRANLAYYTYKCNIRHAFTKMSAGSDMKSQLICAVLIQHHPISHDIKHFPKLFSKMLDVIPMNIMVLDKGYDAESVHRIIRNENVISADQRLP